MLSKLLPQTPLIAEPLACSRTGCFFQHLCWVSGLGLISRKYPGIFFCHGGIRNSNKAIKSVYDILEFLSLCLSNVTFFLSGPQVLYWWDEVLTIGQGWHHSSTGHLNRHFSVIKSAEPLDGGSGRKCQVCSWKSEKLPIKRTFAEVPHWPRYSAILKALSSKRMLANSFPFILVSVLKE